VLYSTEITGAFPDYPNEKISPVGPIFPLDFPQRTEMAAWRAIHCVVWRIRNSNTPKCDSRHNPPVLGLRAHESWYAKAEAGAQICETMLMPWLGGGIIMPVSARHYPQVYWMLKFAEEFRVHRCARARLCAPANMRNTAATFVWSKSTASESDSSLRRAIVRFEDGGFHSPIMKLTYRTRGGSLLTEYREYHCLDIIARVGFPSASTPARALLVIF